MNCFAVELYHEKIGRWYDGQGNEKRKNVDLCLDITKISVDIHHLVTSVDWEEYVHNGRICEIRDLMLSIRNNTSEILEILYKEDVETKNNADQYKRIGKQLDKLIALMSENE